MIKKIIPYILILVITFGLFSPVLQARAQTPPLGICNINRPAQGGVPAASYTEPNITKTQCTADATAAGGVGTWIGTDTGGGVQTPVTVDPAGGVGAGVATTPATPGQSALEKNSGGCATLLIGQVESCLVKITYYIFYSIPAFFLTLSANFFNVIIALTLSSVMYTSEFISGGWGIVRDLSNMFFILILLYIAIKIILGMGGHDVKKMVGSVIIMALLINFSMFFTEVVIDSSNILALIFYNQISTEAKVTQSDGTTKSRDFIPVLKGRAGEIVDKDISGGLVSAFDPSRLMTDSFFEKARTKSQTVGTGILNIGGSAVAGAAIGSIVPVVGTVVGGVIGGIVGTVGYFLRSDTVPPALMIGIILTTGLIMGFAAYTFLVAGLSFLSRLIELWIMIIFSPFAFMSSSVPLLSGIPGIGWSEWVKRLLKLSFMAPIFMFFLYLIFKLVSLNLFQNLSDRTFDQQGTLEAIVLITIPALIILIMLHKATSYAKKGSGELGEKVFGAAKMVGGLALGAATGGAAIAGRATIGRAGAALANSEWAKRRESEGRFGSGVMRDVFKFAGTGSFDARGVKIAGKDLGGTTGIPLGQAQQGGFEKRRKDQVEKRQKRAKELEVGEDENLKQELNGFEQDLQGLLRQSSARLEYLDKQIQSARENANDLKSAATLNPTGQSMVRHPVTGAPQTNEEAFNTANAELEGHKQEKADIRFARGAYAGLRANGRTIRQLEVETIPGAHHNIQEENRDRRVHYAEAIQTLPEQAKNFFFSAGQHSPAGAREAAHKIIMEQKLDSGEKSH